MMNARARKRLGLVLLALCVVSILLAPIFSTWQNGPAPVDSEAVKGTYYAVHVPRWLTLQILISGAAGSCLLLAPLFNKKRR
jgi:hypothetical protein